MALNRDEKDFMRQVAKTILDSNHAMIEAQNQGLTTAMTAFDAREKHRIENIKSLEREILILDKQLRAVEVRCVEEIQKAQRCTVIGLIRYVFRPRASRVSNTH